MDIDLAMKRIDYVDAVDSYEQVAGKKNKRPIAKWDDLSSLDGEVLHIKLETRKRLRRMTKKYLIESAAYWKPQKNICVNASETGAPIFSVDTSKETGTFFLIYDITNRAIQIAAMFNNGRYVETAVAIESWKKDLYPAAKSIWTAEGFTTAYNEFIYRPEAK